MAVHELDPLETSEIELAATHLSAAHAKSQDDYDQAIRLIASGAVAVSTGLVAALGAGWSGGLAIGFAIAALTANLLSHATAQADTGRRLDHAWAGNRAGIHGGRWKTATTVLNVLAGACVVASGVALRVFVTTHTTTT
jgi:hypothetical protein